ILKHPNIMSLKKVIRERERFILYECNLLQLVRSRAEPFSENEARHWFFQVLQGLHYMYGKGYFHRDLKLENLLGSKGMIKIDDMGSAKVINSSPPFTDYFTTRWYRDPEVILGSVNYSFKVDMWAMGAIMAELLMFKPLFPRRNSSD
ncbi:hypothetical protein Ddye_011729, partial [Dipteronia dyeriana]